jgi:hypothetical protein
MCELQFENHLILGSFQKRQNPSLQPPSFVHEIEKDPFDTPVTRSQARAMLVTQEVDEPLHVFAAFNWLVRTR